MEQPDQLGQHPLHISDDQRRVLLIRVDAVGQVRHVALVPYVVDQAQRPRVCNLTLSAPCASSKVSISVGTLGSVLPMGVYFCVVVHCKMRTASENLPPSISEGRRSSL
jgi:hypothetical protein